MRDDYKYLRALSDEADEEVRSQIRLLCEMPITGESAAPPRRVLPRHPETARLDAR